MPAAHCSLLPYRDRCPNVAIRGPANPGRHSLSWTTVPPFLRHTRLPCRAVCAREGTDRACRNRWRHHSSHNGPRIGRRRTQRSPFRHTASCSRRRERQANVTSQTFTYKNRVCWCDDDDDRQSQFQNRLPFLPASNPMMHGLCYGWSSHNRTNRKRTNIVDQKNNSIFQEYVSCNVQLYRY